MRRFPVVCLIACTLLTPIFAFHAVAEPVEPPARVLIIGDSLMRLTASSLGRMINRRGGAQHHAYTSLGSGLARLDIFDWLEKIDELVETVQPDLTIAWFGANDNQPMRVGGDILRTGSEAWETEYARRVGVAMDKLAAGDRARLLWMELPDMREPGEQAHATCVNRILRAEAARRSAVSFFETRTFLSRQAGTFAPYIIDPGGRIVHVRAADGGHLNPTGADLAGRVLMDHIFKRNE